MLRRLAAALLLRRLAKDLHALSEAVLAQNLLLTRLVDHLAPVDPVTTRGEVHADTGVSHLDSDEAARAFAYIARVQRDTGHTPDDDEVLVYLADEKTQDLHTRLASRDEELTRLREAREW